MDRSPVVRARHLKTILEAVDRLTPPVRDHVRGSLTPDVLRAVADGTGMEWMPLELNVQLARAMLQMVGPARAHEFWRQLTRDTFDSRLFKALADAAVLLFGLDPGSYTRWVPRGWGLVYRNCGSWTAARHEDRHAVLRVHSLPLIQDAAWLAGIASAFSALFDLAKTTGAVDIREVDERTGSAKFVLQWGT